MTAVDLRAEFSAAGEALRRVGWKRLAHRGLTPQSLPLIGFAGAARIVGVSEDRYKPHAQGKPAIIVPVWDGPIYDPVARTWPSPLVDLVAWLPGPPERLRRRLGVGNALGIAAIGAALSSRVPLRLFRSPGAWAAAGADRAGAIVLDWNGAVELLQLEQIVADDIDHAREINHRLRRLRARLIPRLPDILVVENVAAA